MSKSTRNGLIAAGAVALVAAIAVVVFVVRPGSLGTSGQAKIAEFVQKNYPVAVDSTDVRETPSASSASIARLQQGVTVNVIGVVEGNDWLQVELPDKRLGYVTASSIPMGRFAAASSPSATAAAAPSNAPVEFTSSDKFFRIAKPAKAYLAPNNTAPAYYTLSVGTRVQSAAKSKNAAWVVVMTEDGKAAFFQTADLVAMTPGGTGDGLPDTVSGPAKVVDTGTLSVSEQTVYLFGVKGATGVYATQMQSMIDSQGQSVNCRRHGEDYVCSLTSGIDIARASLYNGGSKVNEYASDDYRQQEARAKSAKVGVWQ